jgi:hypothetical protein
MANGSDNLTHRRLRGLDHKLDNLIDMVRDLGSQMTAFETRLTALETRMTTLDTSVHGNITMLFGRLDRIQIRLDWIERRLQPQGAPTRDIDDFRA